VKNWLITTGGRKEGRAKERPTTPKDRQKPAEDE